MIDGAGMMFRRGEACCCMRTCYAVQRNYLKQESLPPFPVVLHILCPPEKSARSPRFYRNGLAHTRIGNDTRTMEYYRQITPPDGDGEGREVFLMAIGKHYRYIRDKLGGPPSPNTERRAECAFLLEEFHDDLD